ncbi:MAG TPA: hypothetical protein VHH88_14395, partial [Verrucomicrobiae bacterium]|nr:hypothetical protein [Verrucomicrobiae bacterium]
SDKNFTGPDFFPVLPWDPLHGWDGKAVDSTESGLGSIADCGFNYAGFVGSSDLRQCERLGLAAILFENPAKNIPHGYQRDWAKFSDEQIDSIVKALVKRGGRNPALRGYFIMDEPSTRDFPALGKAVAVVKKYAPGKLAYINLFPNYATLGAPDTSQLGASNYTEYLERFVSEVKPQMLSYDNYMVEYSGDLRHPEIADSYFQNILEVRRVGQEHGLPCLQIVSSNQLRPGHPPPSPANLALQAYTTLAAGFRGVTWYTYYGRGYQHASVEKGSRTATWNYLHDVNRQIAALAPTLRRLRSTGVFFTSPNPWHGLPMLPGRIVQSVESHEPMMVGEFQSPEGENYFLIVNLSLERSANFSLKTAHAAGALYEVSCADGEKLPYKPGKDGFWLPAGQGTLVEAL